MLDKHPIDLRFRERASAAGVTPPEHIRANVMAAVRTRRRRAAWWRAGRLGLLLLFMLGGGFVVYQRTRPELPDPALAERGQDLSETNSSTPVAAGNTTRLQDGASATPDIESASPGHRARSESSSQKSTQPARTPLTLRAEMAMTVGFSPLPANDAIEAVLASEMIDHESPSPMAALVATPVIPSPYLRQGASPDYYKQRGQWWIGAAVTAQLADYNWVGSQERLVDALNAASQPVAGASLSLLGGRQWASGLRLGLGAEFSRAEQSFRMIEREAEVVSETVTNVVTLNTLVVFTTTDTLRRTVVHEDDLSGRDQRTCLSIPLELSWVKPMGRWRAGPRLGLAVSKNWVSSSSSLAQSITSERISSVQLSQDELRERYPMFVSALAGLDLGFVAQEGWVVYASPFMSRGLETLGGADGARARPDHFGLRFLISHSL